MEYHQGALMDDLELVREKVVLAFAVQQVSKVVDPWIEAAGLCLRDHEFANLNGERKLASRVLEQWYPRLKVS